MIKVQPLPPLPTLEEMAQKSVSEYVLEDIADRIEMGEKKYGTKLHTMNTRDSLWDAYEEALDLVMYLRQTILRQEKCKCGHRREDHLSSGCNVSAGECYCACHAFKKADE